MTRFAEGHDGKSAVDPLAFLVGRVEVKYGGDTARTTSIDLDKFIDPKKKTVASVTGELKLNYGTGLCTLDSPRAQGVTGFLSSAGEIKLADAVIRSSNPYATVLLVALDDKPLRESERVLVQVGTLMRPTGWTTEETTVREGTASIRGKKVIHTGKMPWRVANTEVTVELKNKGLTRAVQLDANGYKLREIAGKTESGTMSVKLPDDCLYAVLSR
jgi:hypothetical protein